MIMNQEKMKALAAELAKDLKTPIYSPEIRGFRIIK